MPGERPGLRGLRREVRLVQGREAGEESSPSRRGPRGLLAARGVLGGKPGVSSLKDAPEGRVAHQAAQTSWNFPGGPVVKTQSFHCRVTGLVPGWGTRILHATWLGQKIKNKKRIDCPNPKCVGDNSVW